MEAVEGTVFVASSLCNLRERQGSLHLKPSLCQYLIPPFCVSSWTPCLVFSVPYAARELQGQQQMGKAGPGVVWINIKLLEPSAGEHKRIVQMRLWETSSLLEYMAELRAQPWVGTVPATSTVLLTRMDTLAFVRGSAD